MTSRERPQIQYTQIDSGTRAVALSSGDIWQGSNEQVFKEVNLRPPRRTKALPLTGHAMQASATSPYVDYRSTSEPDFPGLKSEAQLAVSNSKSAFFEAILRSLQRSTNFDPARSIAEPALHTLQWIYEPSDYLTCSSSGLPKWLSGAGKTYWIQGSPGSGE